MTPARSDSTAETHRIQWVFHRLEEPAPFLKEGCKEVQDSNKEGIGVGGGIRLTGHRRAPCRPLYGSACNLGKPVFPEVTFYLPILSQPPGRKIERLTSLQGISGPGSYLTHFRDRSPPLRGQCPAPAPPPLGPSDPMQDLKQPAKFQRFINTPFKCLKKVSTTKKILIRIPDIIKYFRDPGD